MIEWESGKNFSDCDGTSPRGLDAKLCLEGWGSYLRGGLGGEADVNRFSPVHWQSLL